VIQTKNLGHDIIRRSSIKSDESIHSIDLSCISVDINSVFSADSSGKIVKWNLDDLSFACSTTIRGAIINSMHIDENFLYTGSSYLDNRIRVLDKENLEVVKILDGHTSSISDLTGNSELLISCSSDSEIRVWDKTTYENINTYKSDQDILLSVVVDDAYIYTGGIGNKIDVLTISDLKLVTELRGTDASVFSLISNQTRLYSGSGEIWWGGPGSPRPPEFETAIRIWEKNTWECLGMIEGHSDNVNALALHESLLLSVSDDGSLRVYDVNSHDEILCAVLNGRGIKDITTDSAYIYTCLMTGSVWKIPFVTIKEMVG